ncbi:MAG TPA: class I SAM-dependent methyltransferase [Candidatus Nanoarchaeia archaeon]|nr:class I SAM-dependent methyltransferase [Candidatus Nanoarchaeia archaeon]
MHKTITQLQPLEQESIARGIPILRSKKGAWLLQKVQEIKPQRILELGTANGYSGCILGSEGAELTSIDVNAIIAEEARQNFKKYEIKAQVLVGDAVEIIKRLAKEKAEYYDLIFIDFAKNKYITVLENCITLVKKGGFIIADNITMDGCQDYQEAVLHHPQLKTELIPIKDGLSCSTKRLSLRSDSA